MQKPNMTCRYSKCDIQYYVCPDCIKVNHYKSCGHSFEHFCMYQNEVFYFAGQELPYPEFIDQMILEGSLPASIKPTQYNIENTIETQEIHDENNEMQSSNIIEEPYETTDIPKRNRSKKQTSLE